MTSHPFDAWIKLERAARRLASATSRRRIRREDARRAALHGSNPIGAIRVTRHLDQQTRLLDEDR